MTIFVKADDEMTTALETAMQLYHRDLAANEVNVTLVVAIAKPDENGDPSGPALKVGGYPALASIRIVPQRDRLQGLGDAEITIDGERWPLLSHDERMALLDHELTHLDLVLKEGAPVRDDGGRPKLKMRKHDHRLEWFVEVADRHGKASQEVQQAAALVDGHGQIYFPFLNVASKATVSAEQNHGGTK